MTQLSNNLDEAQTNELAEVFHLMGLTFKCPGITFFNLVTKIARHYLAKR